MWVFKQGFYIHLFINHFTGRLTTVVGCAIPVLMRQKAEKHLDYIYFFKNVMKVWTLWRILAN